MTPILAYCVEDYNHFQAHRFFGPDMLEDAEVYMIHLVREYQEKLSMFDTIRSDWKTIRMLIVRHDTSIGEWETQWTAEELMEAKY